MTHFPKYFTYTQADKENLKKCDVIFAKYMDVIGDVEVEVRPDLFSALVHSIIGQQISIKAQATIWDRFIFKARSVQQPNRRKKKIDAHDMHTPLFGKSCDNDCVCPENIILMSEEDIQSCGMTFKKAQNILDLAQKIHSKTFDLDSLKNLSDKEIIKELCTLKGVGKWTAEMMMLFSMQRPDILSLGDLGIQKGLCIVFNKESLTKAEGIFYQEKFRPYGSLASLFLWKVVGLGIKI